MNTNYDVTTLLRRNGVQAVARADPEPEALFLAGFVLGAAMWLAWAKWWRLL